MRAMKIIIPKVRKSQKSSLGRFSITLDTLKKRGIVYPNSSVSVADVVVVFDQYLTDVIMIRQYRCAL